MRDIINNDHQFLPNTNRSVVSLLAIQTFSCSSINYCPSLSEIYLASNVAALDSNSRSPLIGIVSSVSSTQRIHKVGTAIEVRSCSALTGGEGEDRDREGPGSGLAVTAKGRQRFKILRVDRQQAGLTYATVRFLSDAVPCVSAT